MTQVWSATQINSNLTGGGTTTVTQGGTNIYAPVYGSEGFTTGLLYFETGVVSTAVSNCAQGIGNTASAIADGDYMGALASSLGVYYSGSSLCTLGVNGASQVSGMIPFVISSGDRIGHALDLVNNLYWIKNITQGTLWYGAHTSGDPATASNGFSLTQAGFTIVANPVVPALNLYTNGDTGTGYFASSSWLGAAPSGFGPFDSAGPTTVFSDSGGRCDLSLTARSGNDRRRTLW